MLETLATCLVDSVKLVAKLIGDIIAPDKKPEYDWDKFFLDLKINTREFKKDGTIKESIDIKLEKFEKHEFYDCYIFVTNYNITAKMLEDKIDNISNLTLKRKEDIRIEQYGNRLYIKLRNSNKMNYEYNPEEHYRRDFKIPIGYNLRTNKLILVDIFKSNNFGCYIAGSAGGGKSVTLRLLLSHLVNCKSRRDLELVIVNTKRVDLKDFQYARNTIAYQLGSKGIEELMLEQLDEMERRYTIIEKADCDDIWEYRKKVKPMAFRLIVVEEISAYKDNKEYQDCMELIASQGRGAGIIPILVTQLPTKDIMKNTIKSNMNTIFGHKTLDNIRSQVICGEGGLENLSGEGHNKIYCSEHQGVEYQGLYISKEIMKEIINKHKKRTTEVAPSVVSANNNSLD